jgi:peptide/nickel transport system ATP-binding protein
VKPGNELLVARNLTKTYRQRTLLSRASGDAKPAIGNVSIAIGKGRTLGVVGASGAGKSTLARCIACLDVPDSGSVTLEGQDLLALRLPSELRRARRSIQMIFQGSAASLNPRFSAIQVVTEPAVIGGGSSSRQRRELGLAMMERVGLPRIAADRRCTEFSGGERQRLAIARALTLHPKVLILDESLSGLDRPIQAHLVNLLIDLQETFALACMFISHDLLLAAHVSDDLAVLQKGHMVEYGSSSQVARHPCHAQTKALLAAASRFRLAV